MQFVINTLISALLIAAATELSRRSSFLSALLISLPITSLIALSLIYFQTGDTQKVSQLSHGIFWLVLPSLGFFLLLPALLKLGWNFWLSLGVSCLALAIFYFVFSLGLRKFGVSF